MGASGTAMHHDMKVQSTLMIACYKAPEIHVRPIKEGKFSEKSSGSCDQKPLDWEGWRKNWSPSHKLHKIILEYIGWFWMLLDWGGRAKNQKIWECIPHVNQQICILMYIVSFSIQ